MSRNPKQARSRNGNKKQQNTTSGQKPEIKIVEEEQPEEPEIPTCLTCVEPITYFAIGDACDHKELCGRCAIRQRKLYGKPECVLCQVCTIKT